MSQDKVNRYKEEKKNRKQLMAKEKQQKTIRKVVGVVIAIVFIGWVGFSVVDLYQNSIPREVVEVDYAAVEEYLNSISK